MRACELEVPGDVSVQSLSDAGPVHLSWKVIHGVMVMIVMVVMMMVMMIMIKMMMMMMMMIKLMMIITEYSLAMLYSSIYIKSFSR